MGFRQGSPATPQRLGDAKPPRPLDPATLKVQLTIRPLMPRSLMLQKWMANSGVTAGGDVIAVQNVKAVQGFLADEAR